MQLAGLRVPDRDVLELARSLRDASLDATAEKLERAHDNEVVVLALTIAEREAILRALDDGATRHSPSSGLCSCVSTRGGCARGSSDEAPRAQARGGRVVEPGRRARRRSAASARATTCQRSSGD